MGSLKLTLSVLVLVYYVAQALECNRCPYKGSCETTECTNMEDKCIKIVMNGTIVIRRCAKSSECFKDDGMGSLVTKTCCDTDLCN